jgi:hypothetical protein
MRGTLPRKPPGYTCLRIRGLLNVIVCPVQIPAGWFSPRLSYRMSLGPKDTLQAFHCRLDDFVSHAPIAAERRCLR